MNERLKEIDNQVEIFGEIDSVPVLSHQIRETKFYIVQVKMKRSSNIFDRIPVLYPEELIKELSLQAGTWVDIKGSLRSYNKQENGKNKLLLRVYAKEISCLDDITGQMGNNHIVLEGYVCMRPVFRTTPLGREITEIFLAVHRPNGISDYLPCICWEKTARYASNLQVGSKIRLFGRIQSRQYQKVLENGSIEQRVAYEVSAYKLEYNEKQQKKIV